MVQYVTLVILLHSGHCCLGCLPPGGPINSMRGLMSIIAPSACFNLHMFHNLQCVLWLSIVHILTTQVQTKLHPVFCCHGSVSTYWVDLNPEVLTEPQRQKPWVFFCLHLRFASRRYSLTTTAFFLVAYNDGSDHQLRNEQKLSISTTN